VTPSVVAPGDTNLSDATGSKPVSHCVSWVCVNLGNPNQTAKHSRHV